MSSVLPCWACSVSARWPLSGRQPMSRRCAVRKCVTAVTAAMSITESATGAAAREVVAAVIAAMTAAETTTAATGVIVVAHAMTTIVRLTAVMRAESCALSVPNGLTVTGVTEPAVRVDACVSNHYISRDMLYVAAFLVSLRP